MTPSPNAVVRVPQGGSRVKSYTPLIVPGHHHKQFSDGRTQKPVGRGMERPAKTVVGGGQDFYAGAKFDLSPEVASLPTPPPTWVIPLVRSQSQPNSPVTTPTGIRIDVNSLFFSPQVTKASSFPGNEMIHVGGSNNTSGNNDERRSPKKPSTERKIETVQPKTVKEDYLGGASSTRKKGGMITNYYQTKKGHQGHARNFTSSSEKAFTSTNTSRKSSNQNQMDSSKPCDITLGSQQKQMYPHLTEHLRGLLKVQG